MTVLQSRKGSSWANFVVDEELGYIVGNRRDGRRLGLPIAALEDFSDAPLERRGNVFGKLMHRYRYDGATVL